MIFTIMDRPNSRGSPENLPKIQATAMGYIDQTNNDKISNQTNPDKIKDKE